MLNLLLPRSPLNVHFRTNRLLDRIGPREHGLALLRQPLWTRQIEPHSTDLLGERSHALLVLGKRLRLDPGTEHLQHLTQKAALPDPFKLGPGELGRNLDADLSSFTFWC